MAIPSGSGTEVLKMDPYTVTGTTDTVILNGAANHIYTIISITVSVVPVTVYGSILRTSVPDPDGIAIYILLYLVIQY
jgi:hypothetical protein